MFQTFIFGLLHGMLQLTLGQCFVSIKGNFLNFNLFLLVDVHIEYHVILFGRIVALNNIHHGIEEALAMVKIQNLALSVINQVVGNLTTDDQQNFFLNFFFLSFSNSVVINL